MAGHSRLVLILGDQLNPKISAIETADKATDVILMTEVASEATYVAHHKRKLAFVFSAMRHFAQELQQSGWRVVYTKLDDPQNAGDLVSEARRQMQMLGVTQLVVTEPSEYRLKHALLESDLSIQMVDDDRFIATHQEFQTWAYGRKQLRMEYFYRDMRRKTGLLMCDDGPQGGQWNFDAENRKPAKGDLFMPSPVKVQPDPITQDVLELVEETFAKNFGRLDGFWFAVTRKDALVALEHFASTALAGFGDYQDAMLSGEPFLYHSILAQYINIGLLTPLEVCARVERAYYDGTAPLNAVEGYIRQIIGWREYVRGIYWLKMPDYIEQNFLDASRDLPLFYWDAQTDMACMASAIEQTRNEAYAHHIQRLMVTGNFAMLAGVDPFQVHEWYLAVYADAYEWVEAPNVIGMSQFADGGILGSKPYAASGNYINKMSDYCSGCRYDVKQKTGENACPFNPLYWDFLDRNQAKLRGNPRLSHVFRTWDKMDDVKKTEYRMSAQKFLASL